MIRLAALAALTTAFLSAVAFAQQPSEPTLTLTVTTADIDIIGRALGSQPYNAVAPLMAKLQMQIVQQQQKKPEELKK